MAEEQRIRVAAAGDVHAADAERERIAASFATLRGEADVVLLAGDLTAYGHPDQARVLADACRLVDVPVLAVLGNHDWHLNRRNELVDVLVDAGVEVLERSWTIVALGGAEVGIVGTKGFVGGFPDSELPDFGEPLLRQVYADTTAEVDALEAGLEAVARCDHRIVLLHYAPTTTTLEGEPRVIWAFLGSNRLAAPIAKHRPDLVLHGHGHMGTFAGSVGDVPVFNVAVPVLGRDFWIFKLGAARGQTPERGQTPNERGRGQTPDRDQRSRREKASRPRPPRTSA